MGFYCESCFTKRHPVCRVGHNFRLLHQRPVSPPISAAKNVRLAEVAQETVDMLYSTKQSGAELAVSASSRLSDVSRGAAACDALLQRLTTNILQLRDEQYRKRSHAVMRIQKCWKQRKGRKMRYTAARLLWGRCYDPSTDSYFYVQRKTGHTQWEVPTFAGKPIDVGDLPRMLASAWNPDGAATAIQGAWRQYTARRNIRRTLLTLYRRVTDKSTGKVYYFNMLARKAQYRRPFALRPGEEPAEYVRGEDDLVLQEAARTCQRFWRATWGRRLLRGILADIYEKVLDPASGAYFYFNKRTGESTWKKPLAHAVGNWDLPLAIDIAAQVEVAQAGGAAVQARVLTEEEAKALISGAAQMWKARLVMKLRIQTVWRRIWDSEYGVYYYFNRKTGETRWTAPPLAKKMALAKRLKVVQRPKLEAEGPETDEEPEEEEEDDEGEGGISPEEAARRAEEDLREEMRMKMAALAFEVGTNPDAKSRSTLEGSAFYPTLSEGGQEQASEPPPVIAEEEEQEDDEEEEEPGRLGGKEKQRASSPARAVAAAHASTGAGAGRAGSTERARSKPKDRAHKLELTTIDLLRIHYNRLRAYYMRTLPGRVERLPVDFMQHGTHLWAALEARLEGTTSAYTKGLTYLAPGPYAYVAEGVDLAALMAAPQPGAPPASEEEVSASTVMRAVPFMHGLEQSDDPESLGVVLSDPPRWPAVAWTRQASQEERDDVALFNALQ